VGGSLADPRQRWTGTKATSEVVGLVRETLWKNAFQLRQLRATL